MFAPRDDDRISDLPNCVGKKGASRTTETSTGQVTSGKREAWQIRALHTGYADQLGTYTATEHRTTQKWQIVHADSQVVHERGSEAPGVIDHSIVRGINVLRVVEQRHGIYGWVENVSLRVTPVDMILCRGVPIQLKV